MAGRAGYVTWGSHRAASAGQSYPYTTCGAADAPVRLRPPKAPASQLCELDVFAIHVIEEGRPAGVEALEWMLLNSVPTTSSQQAFERLALCARRWTIESVPQHTGKRFGMN